MRVRQLRWLLHGRAWRFYSSSGTKPELAILVRSVEPRRKAAMSKRMKCVVLSMTFGRCAGCGKCIGGLHGVKEMPDGKLTCYCGRCCPCCAAGNTGMEPL